MKLFLKICSFFFIIVDVLLNDLLFIIGAVLLRGLRMLSTVC